MPTRPFERDPAPEYAEISGDGFTLRFEATALQTLQSLVRQGAEGPHKRALEVGGLLMGTDASDISIEAVDAVTIDHRFGPSYQLSMADLAFYERTIAEMGEQSGKKVIGHFRSHSRGEPVITPADLSIGAMIGEQQPLVLLIKSSRTEPSIARLYRTAGENGGLLLAFSLPGPVKELTAKPPEREIATDEPEVCAPEAEAATEQLSKWKIPLAAGLFALAALVGYLALHKPPLPEPAAPTGIGLTAKTEGGGLAVSWNWSSLAIHDAESGVLVIDDGGVQRKFQLTAEGLRSTKFLYVPQGSSVQVRLEVHYAKGRFGGETITVNTGVPETAPRAPAEQPKAGRPAARASPPTVIRPVPMEPVRTARQARRGEGVIGAKSSAAEPARPRLREFSPPERRTTGTSQPLDPGPAPAAGLALSMKPDPLSMMAPSAAPAAPPPITYAAPVSIRKTSPAIADSLRSLIQDKLTVEVKVTINAEGRVTGATPMNVSNPTQKMLAPSAAQAAMLWRFEPARRNGQPVDSETVLRFDFERQAH